MKRRDQKTDNALNTIGGRIQANNKVTIKIILVLLVVTVISFFVASALSVTMKREAAKSVNVQQSEIPVWIKESKEWLQEYSDIHLGKRQIIALLVQEKPELMCLAKNG